MSDLSPHSRTKAKSDITSEGPDLGSIASAIKGVALCQLCEQKAPQHQLHLPSRLVWCIPKLDETQPHSALHILRLHATQVWKHSVFTGAVSLQWLTKTACQGQTTRGTNVLLKANKHASAVFGATSGESGRADSLAGWAKTECLPSL